ncbi:Signal transduction histidine kinase [Clostridium cavendishii DSM 21758]|uniref:histidine kinase n=1 Tax=Clostridium cavendishii DSM 21758 TaxID=1121302 RepID=A0A1M6EMV9_9CLOT|nr:HAMP domain-containing sensor histidine kinase [Clostridium cavendishii]SHI86756.1 Signal transduction histidine kinase [Clostridium cavendishii DSM 21758]
MKSIKSRVVMNFMSIVCVTVLIIEGLFMLFVRYYFYESTENLLTNEIKISAEFYEKYLLDSSLKDNVYDNVDLFWNKTSAQVQIRDQKGVLLMDSIGISKDNNENLDIQKALKGQKGKWVGKVDYNSDSVMAVSYPIKKNNEVIGVIRYITSLKEVNNSIKNFLTIFILIGVLVLMIGIILSNLFANSIANPIKAITKTAERMAAGDLKVRNFISDRDEIGTLSNTLNYMADEILKRDKMKNEFISSVSHELRTPLTAIKGWVITLNSDETDKDTLKLGFDIIEKETDRLSDMVEELLDFSKLVQGKMSLSKSSIRIKDVVEYIKAYAEHRADREEKTFSIEYDDNIENIYADENRLKQVFINLINNAFNFTEPKDTISVNISNEEKYVVIIVKDSGIGISPEDLERVKEKFYKGKNSKSQNGIGLSVCDEIIKLHNGRFIILSELGVMTEAIVKIPKNIKES